MNFILFKNPNITAEALSKYAVEIPAINNVKAVDGLVIPARMQQKFVYLGGDRYLFLNDKEPVLIYKPVFESLLDSEMAAPVAYMAVKDAERLITREGILHDAISGDAEFLLVRIRREVVQHVVVPRQLTHNATFNLMDREFLNQDGTLVSRHLPDIATFEGGLLFLLQRHFYSEPGYAVSKLVEYIRAWNRPLTVLTLTEKPKLMLTVNKVTLNVGDLDAEMLGSLRYLIKCLIARKDLPKE